MEKIELRVMENDGATIDHHWHVLFGMAGGTIGRGGQNKLILPDAGLSVARVHAMVRCDVDGAFIANLSERDPIWVGDQQLRSGQEVALPFGTCLRIGKYTLCAVAPDSPVQAAAAPAAAMPQQEQAASRHRPLIPDDFDAFAAPPGQAHDAQDGWSASLPGPASGQLIAGHEDALMRELPLDGQGIKDLHDDSHTGLPAGLDAVQQLDPLVLMGGTQALPASHDLPPAGARGSELGQAFNLPRIQPEGLPAAALLAPAPAEPAPQEQAEPATATGPDQPPAAQVQSLPAGEAQAAAPSADHAALLDSLAQAFIEGAGLDPARTRLQLSPQFMRTFGEALQIAVQGTIELLAARSEIKQEFRAGVTIIASGANNPFKFLPNAEGVITQMIHQTFPGFMKPLPAMKEAYADLHVHQLALMAGIRAAYSEALARFDPGELERRAESQPGLLDKILTNGRKAALWDDYRHNFDVLRRHAEDDLAAFSGRTFVQAYEQAERSAREQP